MLMIFPNHSINLALLTFNEACIPMYKFLLLLITMALLTHQLHAESLLERNAQFAGAMATKEGYKAIYQLDQSNPDIIKKAIRNIHNLLEDPRLKGKVQVELIAYAGGTEAYIKGSPFEQDLKSLVEKGVIVAQCSNSLKERKMTKDQLFDFIGYVPSANGELIIRNTEGWTIIKP